MNEENKMTHIDFYSLLPQSVKVPEIIDKKSGRQWINWGDDNKLPQYLWDTYLSCSDLQTLINRTVDYVNGANVEVTKPETMLTNDDSFEDIVTKSVFDYITFGGFALECIRNSRGDIVRVNYLNVMNVRVNEELTKAYLSNNWGSWSGKNVIEMPLYDKNEMQPHFIYFYRGAITRNINPIPIWFAGLKSAQVLNETRNYNLREIQNNFSPNVIISLNGTSIKGNELKEIKEKLSHQYEGTDNAGKTMLINNINSDGKVEVTRLEADKAADVYRNVQESSQKDLRMAFAMNEALLGINYSSGFQAVEYENIYKLYQSTIISPLRGNVKKAFNKLGIGVNFIDKKIEWE